MCQREYRIDNDHLSIHISVGGHGGAWSYQQYNNNTINSKTMYDEESHSVRIIDLVTARH